MQDTDEALSVLTSVKQGCSNQKAPQTVCRDAPFPPSSVHSVQKPETQNRQPVVSTSPKTPSSDPDQSDEPESAAPPPPQGCVETDEQIERLLEDIMMGLNILPNMDDNCKKSQLNHDGAPAFCHVPGTEGGVEQNHMHAGVGAAGCVFYQDLGTRSTHSSAETGILCCFGAQSQPSCPGLPAAQPDLLIPQHRSKFESSVGSTGQSEAMSFQDVLSSKSENSLGLVPTPKESAVPLPSLQQPSSQEDPTVLDFLPLLRGSEMHSEQTLSSSCIDDLRLPGRLSPLEPRTSAAPDEPLPNSSANPEGEPQRQPLLHRRPWLTETPGSLQFPLRAIAADKSASPPQDPNDSVHSSHDFEKEKETEKETELSAELKSEPNKMKESLKCTQHDATEDAEAPKRRRRRCRGLASKKSEVSDGTKTFSFVSLSSKKMLVKERETTSTPSNKFCTRLRKLKEAPAVSEKTRGPEALSAGQTRIRTRGFVKKSQENAGNTIPEMSRVLIPVIHRAVVVDEQGRSLPRRKRGRPCKMKLEESLSGNLPIITENKSHDEAGEQQADKDAPQVEKDEKTKKRGRKRRMNPTEAAAVPQKKSTSDECSVKAEGDDKVKKVDAPERSWMVTLKEFQKLIKRQHSKTKKSKESQDVCQPVREEKAKGGDTLDGSANEADMDIKDQVPLNVSVDENHNQLSNAAAAQRSRTHHDDTNGSTGLFGHPVSSSGVLEEEQPLKNPDEGTFCSSGGSDATQFASSDEDAPHSDSRVPPQNKTANSSPDIPKKLGPPASLADEISVSSDGSQEEEEEEEVDVLLYSPEKGPLNTGCEDGPSNMVLISDEEEEEDVNEIDVTGDEGE
ncbi:uncharacterized protein PAE49_004603 [Odontesthes bonariensis]|uniref:uncharacterized protein LOC142379337 n=1 Tax=Odontesthes bonariensis TaxID=219752 RepID=UPI003F585EA7